MMGNPSTQFIPQFNNGGPPALHQQNFNSNENLMSSNRRVMLNGTNNTSFRKNSAPNCIMTTKRKVEHYFDCQIFPTPNSMENKTYCFCL